MDFLQLYVRSVDWESWFLSSCVGWCPALYTLENEHGTTKSPNWRGKSSSKHFFLGFHVNFPGCSATFSTAHWHVIFRLNTIFFDPFSKPMNTSLRVQLKRSPIFLKDWMIWTKIDTESFIFEIWLVGCIYRLYVVFDLKQLWAHREFFWQRWWFFLIRQERREADMRRLQSRHISWGFASYLGRFFWGDFAWWLRIM